MKVMLKVFTRLFYFLKPGQESQNVNVMSFNILYDTAPPSNWNTERRTLVKDVIIQDNPDIKYNQIDHYTLKLSYLNSNLIKVPLFCLLLI